MIVITLANEDGIVLDQYFTDESYPDINTVMNRYLSVYCSKEDLEQANAEDDEADSD